MGTCQKIQPTEGRPKPWGEYRVELGSSSRKPPCTGPGCCLKIPLFAHCWQEIFLRKNSAGKAAWNSQLEWNFCKVDEPCTHVKILFDPPTIKKLKSLSKKMHLFLIWLKRSIFFIILTSLWFLNQHREYIINNTHHYHCRNMTCLEILCSLWQMKHKCSANGCTVIPNKEGSILAKYYTHTRVLF